MTIFLRLLNDKDKQSTLLHVVKAGGDRQFVVDPSSFSQIPGSPFAYWVSESVRQTFQRVPAFDDGERTVKQGLATADDFRFVRTWWEVQPDTQRWFAFAKGGSFSRFYADIPAVLNWHRDGAEICNFFDPKTGRLLSVTRNTHYYGRPGLTWPLRGITFSAQLVPRNCIFSVAGKMAFAPVNELEAWLAIFNSSPFDYLIRLFAGKVGGVQYEVGLIGGIPAADLNATVASELASLARRGWSLKRMLASTEETSHAFLLPLALRSRLGDYDPTTIEQELQKIQKSIDDIAFSLYQFSDSDRIAAMHGEPSGDTQAEDTVDEDEDQENCAPVDSTIALLSWATGVSFGRFDWRIATQERDAPVVPEPLAPLPERSPGMLPKTDKPFHEHFGILVDDPGHKHDLPHLIETILDRVNASISTDIRRWLRRDFFPFHLQRYSKSRRKAPIYWPLSIASGNYTLWVYYPTLTSQTLYKAINDFLEPKLQQVADDVHALVRKSNARSKDDEKLLETLQALELELHDLRDELLKLAPTYKPVLDDGVQICAAPLWKLFRHKPWQNVLKDTWSKLHKGDYDWAGLALNYWPDRVREKCKSDKSLSIAHGLEELYTDPLHVTKKSQGKKITGVNR